MSEDIHHGRRRFLGGLAVMSMGAAELSSECYVARPAGRFR